MSTTSTNIKAQEYITKVFNLTKDTPYERSLTTGIKEIGTNVARSYVHILLSEGILVNEGSLTAPIYKWNNTMHITDHMIKDVTDKAKQLRGKWTSVARAKRHKGATEPAIELTIPKTDDRSLSEYTDKELWEALQKRGYAITEDGKLAKTVYLN